MGTRIFKVEYWYVEKFKNELDFPLESEDKTTKTLVAQDAFDAISRARDAQEKDCKKIKSILHDFDPINVTLEAESD